MPVRHADRYLWQTTKVIPRRIVVRAIPYILSTDAQDRLRVGLHRSLVIEDGMIVANVLAGREKRWLKNADVIYEAGLRGGIVVTPGFINAHAHPPMYLLRSSTFLEYEQATTEESLVVARQIERAMTLPQQTIAAIGDFTEQQKFGTTTVLSHYHAPEATRAAAMQAYIRLVDAVSVASVTNPQASIKNATPWLRSRISRITPGITIHTLERVSLAELQKVRQLMRTHRRLLLTIHCGETFTEVAAVEAKHGLRPIALLDKVGLLNHRLILSHAVHLTNEEIALLGKRQVGIVHLPTSNRFHKSGQFKYSDFVVAGGAPYVALGTDSVISKSKLDLMSEGFMCKLMHQDSLHPASFADIFRMLTSNGARVLNMEHHIGRVLPGYKADLVFWKLKDRMFIPFAEQAPATLVGNFIAHGGYVARDVMVDGQFVISGRRHNFVNESKLLADLQRHHSELRERVLRKK